MANITIVPPKSNWRVLIHHVTRVGSDLDVEFRRQAELMGKAGYFNAQAKRRVRQLRQELEVISARLRKRIRLSEGKMTKDEMHYAVERKKLYRNKMRELDEAIYQEDLLKGLLNSLEHKKDMLVQLGAASRKGLPDELRALSESLGRMNRRLDHRR